MKCVTFVLISVLLGATSALSQISAQPYRTIETGSPIGIYNIFGHPSIAYSPDGELLAVATHDGLYLCDTSAWGEPRLLVGGHILSVAFSQDGAMLAAGGRDNVVHLWDRQSEEHTELKGHEDSVAAVCFSPDSQTLASSGQDITVRFWSVEHKEEIGLLSLMPFREAGVYSLEYRHDGSMLAIGAYHTIYLYDPEEQQILSTLRRGVGTAGWPEMWILCMEFSPDGTILAAGSGDNQVELWDVSELTRIEQLLHNGDVNFVSFTPNGRQLAYGGYGRSIRIYDMALQEIVSWDWEGLRSRALAIPSGAISPDGRTLATASSEGIIAFWAMPEAVTAVQPLRRKSVVWGMLRKE